MSFSSSSGGKKGSGKDSAGASRQHFLETMAAGIREMYQDGTMADIDIIVEGETFPCHRIVLATFSPYFKAMFHSGMVETRSNQLTIPDISRKCFEIIRDFIYQGDCSVKDDMACEVLQAAALFQVNGLQEKCEVVLAKEMDSDNCWTLFKIARSCNCQILLEKCRPFVLEGFNGLWKSDEFTELDWEDIQSIVRDDDLVPVDEEQICEAALKWIEADLPERKKYLSKLFRHIRLVKVSPEYLVEELYNNELLLNDPECRRYLNEVRNYHMLPARQQEFSTSRFFLRNSDDYETVMLVLTEYDMERSSSFNQDGKCLWAYSFQQERWFTLAAISFQQNPGIQFSVATFRNDMYLTGGNQGTSLSKNMLRYDSERNEWVAAEGSLKRGRCNHMTAAVRESIFVIGGQNSKMEVQGSIEEYSINSRRWRTMGELAVPVMSASMVVVGEKIFILGGKIKDDEFTNAIQIFDVRNREVREGGEIPTALVQPLHSLSFDNRYFVISANGDFCEFRPGSGKFKVLKKLSNECLPILGVSHYRGYVILLSATKDKPLIFSKIYKLNMHEAPFRMDQIVGQDQYKTKPKPIHACVHCTMNKQFMYHTYFQ